MILSQGGTAPPPRPKKNCQEKKKVKAQYTLWFELDHLYIVLEQIS